MIPNFIKNDFLIVILKKFDENPIPKISKVITSIPRLFQVIQLHSDGIPLIESNFDLIDKLLDTLVQPDYLPQITSDTSSDLGEFLHDVVSRIP